MLTSRDRFLSSLITTVTCASSMLVLMTCYPMRITARQSAKPRVAFVPEVSVAGCCSDRGAAERR